MNWKDQTCETCTYRDGERCRFNPPTSSNVTKYPDITEYQYNRRDPKPFIVKYFDACSKWEKEQDENEI